MNTVERFFRAFGAKQTPYFALTHRPSRWLNTAIHLKKSDQGASMIKPALLIGTGFHHYVSGNVESHEKLAPLVSWNSLINAVGRKASLALPSNQLPPVYRWEGLVHQAGAEGFNGIEDEFYAAGTIGSDEVQLNLKQLAADVIKEAGSYSPTKRAMFPSDDVWGSVISLNYDQAWINSPLAQLQGAVPDLYELPVEEKQRLTAFVLYNGKRIWFPNGTISDPASIRIGLSDYGSKAYGIARMLHIVSDFESEHLRIPANVTGHSGDRDRFAHGHHAGVGFVL